ncbi:MAG: hypothetical protein JWN52_1035 [Actinomycetia bacterium]|nr:hypothetical protein [Actinomycetes bacterium]
MDGVTVAGLVLAGVGTVAGIAGAWYARVAVVPKRRARRAISPAAPAGGGGSTFDVYISYSQQDADWVQPFAERLRQEGIKVAYDKALNDPGRGVVHTQQRAILESAHGLLVFSEASKADGWIDALDYPALLQRTAVTGQRFIPLLVEDVELPLFAQNFYRSDFRNVTRKEYDERIAELVRALRP